MHALFVTFDGGGNLPPTLGIAAELTRRGATVEFLGHARQRGRIEDAGFVFEAYRRGRDYDITAPRRTLGGLLDFTALVTDRGVAADMVEAADGADVVVVDCLLYRALLAGAEAGLPVVSLEHTLHGFFLTYRGGPVGLTVRLRGVRVAAALAAPRLTLVATRPELDTATATASVRHTGFVWQGTPVAAEPPRGAPRILVSYSTTHFPGQAAALQRAIDGLAGLAAEVLVTTGPTVDPAALRPAANTTIVRWADHGDLLPETSLVVSHGGHSTVSRTLAHGIPLLVVPMHPLLDQPAVGRAVAAQGAGLTLPKSASPAQVMQAAATLLADGPHRAAAVRLGESIRSRDGAVVAADLLAQFARDPRRAGVAA
ncbi:protein of unknown function DUF1205 [Xylanimonas cellulosilytica DSM 15894]|uniref:Erythromycin biosynthesis protein CIII-like C-terminal domain-containing protein n=1 Tax=Xylanimonas cellulosilytica (strain DSM 15894 / JCM 12276 / CECT 5975 / KCTC 9989 / LMG 20990 / NBRC 107835 / XIL07) TaxID=446471 RepID=D1BV27_XYLCX|nr:glycosyltransferase [Xylanimonas cellulosilytica]ACZ31266.1 protein of unknown function DUF1205 [Xylanimonas cellulosilytica DSM 15894]